MTRYLINEDGFLLGQTEGQRTPHGQILYPDNSIEQSPPLAGDLLEAKWNGSSWDIVSSPKKQAKKDKENLAKLQILDENKIPDYFLDIDGEVKVKSPAQKKFDLGLQKIQFYISQRDFLLIEFKRYAALIAISPGSQTTLKLELKTYYDDLVALGATIDDTTDLGAIVWPTLPDLSSVDPIFGEDLLS
jgi:hypothetical protein